jgi:hypothetical protein
LLVLILSVFAVPSVKAQTTDLTLNQAIFICTAKQQSGKWSQFKCGFAGTVEENSFRNA